MIQRICKGVLIAATGLALTACSAGNLLSGKSSVPQAAAVPTGNQLALPPDLALRAPAATTDAYVPNGPVASLDSPPAAANEELYSSAAPGQAGVAPKQRGGTLDETLAFYNISKVNADGSPKSSADINRELSAAIKADKKRQNPNYGTIFNIGDLFSDG